MIKQKKKKKKKKITPCKRKSNTVTRQNQPMLLFPLHIKISYEGIDVQYYPIGCKRG